MRSKPILVALTERFAAALPDDKAIQRMFPITLVARECQDWPEGFGVEIFVDGTLVNIFECENAATCYYITWHEVRKIVRNILADRNGK